jgi:hypothetical protein
MNHTYEINPRPTELGGGWRLRLLVDGEEVGGGAFPANVEMIGTEEVDHAYQDAYHEADSRLRARQEPGV